MMSEPHTAHSAAHSIFLARSCKALSPIRPHKRRTQSPILRDAAMVTAPPRIAEHAQARPNRSSPA